MAGKQDEINSVSAGLNAGADAVMGALGGLSSVGDFAATTEAVTGEMTGGIGSIPDISSSLGSALSFANVVTNVFAGELKPKQALQISINLVLVVLLDQIVKLQVLVD